MMQRALLFLILLSGWLIAFDATAQTDSVRTELPDSVRAKEHSPTRATLFSACLPGLGQVYNGKYWKVPIVYAGFGLMTYFIVTNANEYISYKCAYIESSYGNTNGSYADLVRRYSGQELLSAREYYRRNLEISILLTAVWYALNILDATVDAHLHTFNISDNLSLRLGPALMPVSTGPEPAAGLKFSLRF